MKDEIDEFLENMMSQTILVKAENSVTGRNVYTQPCLRILKPELLTLKKKWETEAYKKGYIQAGIDNLTNGDKR